MKMSDGEKLKGKWFNGEKSTYTFCEMAIAVGINFSINSNLWISCISGLFPDHENGRRI